MICQEITNAEYSNLVDPQFVGQTRSDENDMYYMIFQSNGILYKIHNKL